MNDRATEPKARPKRRRSCPMCGRPAAQDFLPFCSRRCADMDLGRWLEGAYRIPAVEPPDGFGEGAEGDGQEPPPGSPGGPGKSAR